MTPPCTTVDPELFFPAKGRSPKQAKQICGQCPLQTPCLQTALTAREWVWGVWGGTTEYERRLMRRRHE